MTGTNLYEINMQSYEPDIEHLGIYLREVKMNTHTHTHTLTLTLTHTHTHLLMSTSTSCSLVLSSAVVSLPQTGHYPTLLSLLQCPGGNAYEEVLGVTPQKPPSEVPGAHNKVTLTSEWINVDGLMGRWTCPHTCW